MITRHGRRSILKLLAAGAAAPSLSMCSSIPPPGDGANGRKVVDVHCHTFNASDLPVEGFLRRVAFSNYEDTITFPRVTRQQVPGVIQELIILLVQITKGIALPAKDEAREIDEGRAARDESDDGYSNAEKRVDEERLRKILQELYGNPEVVKRVIAQPPSPTEESRTTFLRALHNEATDILRSVGRPVGTNPFEDIVAALYADERITAGLIIRHLRWGFLLTRPRRKIVNRYKSLYSGPGVALLTPALIDYDHWLDDRPVSPLADQIEVVDRLQRLPGNIRMHSFIAFDPWRDAADIYRRRPRALDLVRKAIGEKGFIGVKLYPPMGFRATLNVGEHPGDNLDFPERAKEIPNFPAALDRSLNDLYSYCADNQVPLMAHAAASNGAGKGFEKRADPKWWGRVLDNSRFKDLHLNLAHFGSFEVVPDGGTSTIWEETIGRLIKNKGHTHLYADVSYLSEFLGDNADNATRDRIRALLKKFVAEFDPDVRHLMYGSDWIMLGREPQHDRMIAVMRQLVVDDLRWNEEQTSRFFSGNALRFLGLQEHGPSWQRISNYYQKHGLRLFPLSS